jgi:hypothetical protein
MRVEVKNSQDSGDLLDIAQKQLSIIAEKRTGKVDNDLQLVDHALIAILMSAAAIEAEVNRQMANPIFCVSNLKLRKYFATLMTEYLRMPIHTKIRFLCECLPGLDLDKPTKAKVVELFSFRNGLVHSAPGYNEYPSRPEHFQGMDETLTMETMPIMSSFSTGVRDTRWLDQAAEYHEVAIRFIREIKKAGGKAMQEFCSAEHDVIKKCVG